MKSPGEKWEQYFGLFTREISKIESLDDSECEFMIYIGLSHMHLFMCVQK